MATLVCFLTNEGPEYYAVSGRMVTKAGNMGAKLIQKLLYKKIVVIAKELTHFKREKYPPVSAKHIRGLVRNSIEETFPMLGEPMHTHTIVEKHKNYTIVNLWAWDSKLVAEIANGFSFTHIVPEDALFHSRDVEITVFKRGRYVHVVAHSRVGFLAARTFTQPLDHTNVDLFLRGAGSSVRAQATRIVSYVSGDYESIADIPVIYASSPVSTPALEMAESADLSQYRVKSWYDFLSVEMGARIAVYAVLCYALSVYISVRNIEESIRTVESAMKKTSKEIEALVALKDRDKQGVVLEALINEMASAASPLHALDVLARNLPKGSYLLALNINRHSVDAHLMSPDPTAIISTFATTPDIQNVQLVGEPVKNSDKTYSFHLNLLLKEQQHFEGLSNQSDLQQQATPVESSQRASDVVATFGGSHIY